MESRGSIDLFSDCEEDVPDRILHQSELNQHITEPVKQLRRVDRKGRIDWAQFHTALIHQWADQVNLVQNQRHAIVGPSEYMRWHWGVTRC